MCREQDDTCTCKCNFLRVHVGEEGAWPFTMRHVLICTGTIHISSNKVALYSVVHVSYHAVQMTLCEYITKVMKPQTMEMLGNGRQTLC